MDTTLLKGLNVLELLAQSEQPKGVSDIARGLNLTKSNVHRTLQTLVAAGYVRVGSRPGTYVCTLKLFELASPLVARLDVRQLAEPVMQALAGKTQETIHLAVLDRLEVIYLHKIESPQPVRAYSSVGGRAPAHAVATGKVLLAWQDAATLATLPERFERTTSRTLPDRDALLAEIAQVRAQGYAINRGEWREGVCGAAAVILDAQRQVIAAVGISGPSERLRPAALRKHAERVVEAARDISRSMGCTRYEPLLPAGDAAAA